MWQLSSSRAARPLFALITFALLGFGGITWWLNRPDRFLARERYEPEFLQGLKLTANGGPVPAIVRPNEDLLFVVEFDKGTVSNDREYNAYIAVIGPGMSSYDAGVSLFRARDKGELSGQMIAKSKSGPRDITPPLRSPSDLRFQYVGLWNTSHIPKGVNPLQPLELQLWVSERDREKALNGVPDDSIQPSMMAWKQTIQIDANAPAQPAT